MWFQWKWIPRSLIILRRPSSLCCVRRPIIRPLLNRPHLYSCLLRYLRQHILLSCLCLLFLRLILCFQLTVHFNASCPALLFARSATFNEAFRFVFCCSSCLGEFKLLLLLMMLQDPEYELLLDIEHNSQSDFAGVPLESISSLIQKSFVERTLDCKCRCGNPKAQAKVSISSLPRVLIVQIKRFRMQTVCFLLFAVPSSCSFKSFDLSCR